MCITVNVKPAITGGLEGFSLFVIYFKTDSLIGGLQCLIQKFHLEHPIIYGERLSMSSHTYIMCKRISWVYDLTFVLEISSVGYMKVLRRFYQYSSVCWKSFITDLALYANERFIVFAMICFYLIYQKTLL